MSIIRKLVGQTAVYGLSSILGRLLNYLLVPLYTRVFHAGEYGVVTQLYAYASFLNVLYTYGLETAFFRFFQSEKENSRVFSTALLSILGTSLTLSLGIIVFAGPIAASMTYDGVNAADMSRYVSLFACIIAFDAISAIPFAKLRQENKARKFAFIRIAGIAVNVGLNFFFLLVCPELAKTGQAGEWLSLVYKPETGVGYVFIINFISSLLTLLLLIPEMRGLGAGFERKLWKQMVFYAFPLMIGGFAGMINETLDRILLPFLLQDKSTAMAQLGIYGACYKLSILMTLFVQTFRYAAEPFYFQHAGKPDAKEIYAKVMHGFVITCSLIFLGIMLYMDIVKVFIGEEYRSGLKVVPVLLMANLCLGVYLNLSIWYKLSDRTRWGAWLSLAGAVLTLVFNFLLIPPLGYMGAAWTTLISYAFMMVLSYFYGQKVYRVPYNVKAFVQYVVFVLILYFISVYTGEWLNLSVNQHMLVNSGLMILFLLVVWFTERRKFGYLRGESGS
ncbi:MAG: polysaccharide biosynthesis protein [Bacteroidia bacterium]|nr:polysaccharide biosynthesis protein [Bacteroidia bacterium]